MEVRVAEGLGTAARVKIKVWGCCSWAQVLEEDVPGFRVWWTQKSKDLDGHLGPECGAEFKEGS